MGGLFSRSQVSAAPQQQQQQQQCISVEQCLDAVFDAARNNDASTITSLCDAAAQSGFTLLQPIDDRPERRHVTMTNPITGATYKRTLTPLQLATLTGADDAIRALLQCGANSASSVRLLLEDTPDVLRMLARNNDRSQRLNVIRQRLETLDLLLGGENGLRQLPLRDLLDALFVQSVTKDVSDWSLRATDVLLEQFAPLISRTAYLQQDVDNSVHAIVEAFYASSTPPQAALDQNNPLAQVLRDPAALRQAAPVIQRVAPLFLLAYQKYAPLSADAEQVIDAARSST